MTYDAEMAKKRRVYLRKIPRGDLIEHVIKLERENDEFRHRLQPLVFLEEEAGCDIDVYVDRLKLRLRLKEEEAASLRDELVATRD